MKIDKTSTESSTGQTWQTLYARAQKYCPYYLLAETSGGHYFDGIATLKQINQVANTRFYLLKCYEVTLSQNQFQPTLLSFEDALKDAKEIPEYIPQKEYAKQGLNYFAAEVQENLITVKQCQYIVAANTCEVFEKARWLLSASTDIEKARTDLLELGELASRLV